MGEASLTIAIARETIGDGVTEAHDLRRANGPTVPSAMRLMVETAVKPDTANHGSEMERPTPLSRFLSGRDRPI